MKVVDMNFSAMFFTNNKAQQSGKKINRYRLGSAHV